MDEYIEREAILNRLNKVHMDNRPFGAGVQFGVDHAISCVIEAPAADVARVVHGRWIDTGEKDTDGNAWFVCNICGHRDLHAPLMDVPHCWFCGAKMDGGKA